MRYHESTSVFQYTWQQVAQALWQRYPNPDSTHVLSEDTLSRRVVDGRLITTRLLIKTNRMPKWGECIVKSHKVAVLECSVVDPVTRQLHTTTTNVGLTKFMSCTEKVTYRPCPDKPGNTMAERRTWIDSTIFGIGRAIQKFGIDRYCRNIERTDRGFVYILACLFPSPAFHKAGHHEPLPHDARQRLLETAQRAKDLLAAEKTRMAAACGEPNT